MKNIATLVVLFAPLQLNSMETEKATAEVGEIVYALRREPVHEKILQWYGITQEDYTDKLKQVFAEQKNLKEHEKTLLLTQEMTKGEQEKFTLKTTLEWERKYDYKKILKKSTQMSYKEMFKLLNKMLLDTGNRKFSLYDLGSRLIKEHGERQKKKIKELEACVQLWALTMSEEVGLYVCAKRVKKSDLKKYGIQESDIKNLSPDLQKNFANIEETQEVSLSQSAYTSKDTTLVKLVTGISTWIPPIRIQITKEVSYRKANEIRELYNKKEGSEKEE
jgi:hypothetical protein